MITFSKYWRSLEALQKKQLVDELDTSTMYLFHIAAGRRNAGKHFKKELMRLTRLPESAFNQSEQTS